MDVIPGRAVLPSRREIEDSIRRDEWRMNPLKFVSDVDQVLWSKQSEILAALAEHDQIAVQTCHKTGKSWGTAVAIWWWLACHPPGTAMVVTTAPNDAQVKGILWRYVGMIGSTIPDGMIFTHRNNQSSLYYIRPDRTEQLVAIGRKPQDHKPTDIQGYNAQFVLVLVDEACGVADTLFPSLLALVSNAGSKIMLIGNPDNKLTEFGKACKPGSGYKVIQIGAFDTPVYTGERVPQHMANGLISKEWCVKMLKKYGADSPVYQSKVLGQFPSHGVDNSEWHQLIHPAIIEQAQNRNLKPMSPTGLALDIAAGGDLAVCGIRQGYHYRTLWKTQERDTTVLTKRFLDTIEDTPSALYARVDSHGMGIPVYDRIREMAREGKRAAQLVTGHNNAKSASDKERFENKRAESFWTLKTLFESGKIDISPDEGRLARELLSLKWSLNKRQRIQMLAKGQRLPSDVQSIGIRSTDYADAMAMAFDTPEVRLYANVSPVWGGD